MRAEPNTWQSFRTTSLRPSLFTSPRVSQPYKITIWSDGSETNNDLLCLQNLSQPKSKHETFNKLCTERPAIKCHTKNAVQTDGVSSIVSPGYWAACVAVAGASTRQWEERTLMHINCFMLPSSPWWCASAAQSQDSSKIQSSNFYMWTTT